LVDIAVVNTSDEIAEVIEWAMRSAGWSSLRASPVDFKRGRIDLSGFLSEHDPSVLVWDVVVPLDENWAYCQAVQRDPAASGRRFILTTNDKRAFHQVAAKVPALEFLATPSDIGQLCTAIRKVWRPS
jgi:hypothetical protein